MKRFIILLVLLLVASGAPVGALTGSNYSHLVLKDGPGFVDVREHGTNKAAFVAALASGGTVFVSSGTYAIDNTAGPITLTVAGTKIVGAGATIVAATSTQSLFLIMANDCTIEGLTVRGPGGIDNNVSYWASIEDKPGLIAAGATGSVVIQRPTISGCVVESPGVRGISLFKTVGAVITGCRVTSTDAVDAVTVSYPTCIGIQQSAYATVQNNALVGMAQGIGIGGNALDTFASGDGDDSGESRYIVVQGNTLSGHGDHCIYVPDDTSNVSIHGNTGSSTYDAVKFTGQNVSIVGNSFHSNGAAVVSLRSTSNATVSGNTLVQNGAGASVFGIRVGGPSVSTTGYRNISITGNSVVCANGGSRDGIRVDGDPYSASHRQIKTLSIANNVLSGWCGDATTTGAYQAGIHVFQDYPSGVTASPAEGISITGNSINLQSSTSVEGSGIIIRNGALNCCVSGNTILNMRRYGVVLHGVSYASVIGNSGRSDPLWGGENTGFVEFLPDAYGTATASFATCSYNLYDNNSFYGLTTSEGLWSSSTTKNKNYTRTRGIATFTFQPAANYDVIYCDGSDPFTITASTSAGPFTQYHTLQIINSTAGSPVTFKRGATETVVPTASTATFIQVDSGYASGANIWVGR